MITDKSHAIPFYFICKSQCSAIMPDDFDKSFQSVVTDTFYVVPIYFMGKSQCSAIVPDDFDKSFQSVTRSNSGLITTRDKIYSKNTQNNAEKQVNRIS